ncbi:hypothetical protein [Bacillus thuringiensis]|uniref:hypothetical protein n=1 Tax=Bacillus thuringiensis TaxID=1428 RepID=UPI000BF77B28|nr:hypothetical protein [Bacillus thuringiensis]PFS25401.1 hypothetical protein COK45_05030 [Bacillus thuringiensis]
MGHNTENDIKKLTIAQLEALVKAIEEKGFFTDECIIMNGGKLVRTGMITKGGALLIKRLQEEAEYSYELKYTSVVDIHRGEVAAVFSLDWYDDITDFRERGLFPFVEKLNKIDPY